MTIDDQIVGALEKWLARARAGELESVAISAVLKKGTVATQCVHTTPALVGAVNRTLFLVQSNWEQVKV